MRIILLYALFIIGGWAGLQAQSLSPQVIASSGEHYANGTTSLSWTLGETMTATYDTGNQQLTQGFHQPELLISGVYSSAEAPLWRVYPNPTPSQITVDFLNADGTYLLTLQDVLGRTLIQQEVANQQQFQLQLDDFAAGNYLLSIHLPQKGQVKTFKIQKIK